MRFMIIDTCEIIDFISGGKISKPLYTCSLPNAQADPDTCREPNKQNQILFNQS